MSGVEWARVKGGRVAAVLAVLGSCVVAAPAAAADFKIGSYGRMGASGNFEGGQGEVAQVASFGDRLQLPPYVELDFTLSEAAADGARFKAVFTPAIAGDPFHYTGEWEADLAVRNAYAEATGFSAAPLSAWVGARMLRGDDVYLLNFWPLDNVNTMGAGLRLAPKGWAFEGHIGKTRLVNSDLQNQLIGEARPDAAGQELVRVLDRQRTVGTLKGSREVEVGELTLRVSAYGELHLLPEGTRIREGRDERIEEELPADRGSIVGMQASLWGWGPDSFVHLWLRRGTGLAIPGNLNLPLDGLAADRTYAGAREHLVALAGNSEGPGNYGVLWGAYARLFRDADDSLTDFDDAAEGTVVLRPAWHFAKHASLAGEVSHQWRQSPGINPRSGEVGLPQVTRLAVLPSLQPHRSNLSRPQLRLQYVYSHLNNDARWMYPSTDPRAQTNHQHLVGVVAEWWLDSVTYRPGSNTPARSRQ